MNGMAWSLRKSLVPGYPGWVSGTRVHAGPSTAIPGIRDVIFKLACQIKSEKGSLIHEIVAKLETQKGSGVPGTRYP
eukprot:2820336-Rhodomonas_salina.1